MLQSTSQIPFKGQESQLKRSLELIDDDIRVADQTIENLQRKKSELSQSISDILFKQDETETKINSIQIQKGDEVEPSFFALLKDLEDEETSIKAKMSSIEKIRKDLPHRIISRQQENLRLSEQIASESEKKERELQSIHTLEGSLSDLASIKQKKFAESREAAEACDKLKADLQQISDRMLANQKPDYAIMLNEKESLAKEIEVLKKKADDATKSRRALEMERDSVISHGTDSVKAAKSVENWKGDRDILVSRVRKVKSSLERTLKSIEAEKAKQSRIAEKFKSILGQSDDGDGSGVLAQRMVLAELDEIMGHQEPATEEDVNIELDYQSELELKIGALMGSISYFNKFKEETISALETEEADSSQKGYIRLLEKELFQLKAKLNRVK